MTTLVVSKNYYESDVLESFDSFVLAEICYNQ